MKYPFLLLLAFTTDRYYSTGFLAPSNVRPELDIGRRENHSRNRCTIQHLSSSSFLELEDTKTQLIKTCNLKDISLSQQIENVRSKVQSLEEVSQRLGIGQFQTLGILSGEWKLLFSSEDRSRSSPFFWAFRKAFPENADTIFSITDSIPSPLKEIGPAFQSIDVDAKTFVSKVTISSLGSESSVMTTKATILGAEGKDGVRIRIVSTKPEDSSILKLLGPFGKLINEKSPPFPSGEALEKIRPGSSEVIIRTTFCDESLRISRNEDRYDDYFVWVRVRFIKGSEL